MTTALIEFPCPCGRQIQKPSTDAGMPIRCPDCGKWLRVPARQVSVSAPLAAEKAIAPPPSTPVSPPYEPKTAKVERAAFPALPPWVPLIPWRRVAGVAVPLAFLWLGFLLGQLRNRSGAALASAVQKAAEDPVDREPPPPPPPTPSNRPEPVPPAP